MRTKREVAPFKSELRIECAKVFFELVSLARIGYRCRCALDFGHVALLAFRSCLGWMDDAVLVSCNKLQQISSSFSLSSHLHIVRAQRAS